MTTKQKSNNRAGAVRPLNEILERISERVEGKQAEKAQKLAAQGYDAEVVGALIDEHAQIVGDVESFERDETQQATKKKARRGVSATRIIEQAQLNLVRRERRGDFTQFPIQPGSEFPSIFARVAIFRPMQRSKALAAAKEHSDQDMGVPFQTGWGEGRKFGPPLTMYDEDTLIAVLGLRQRQLVGKGSKMPAPVESPFGPGDTQVQVLYVTASMIEEYLGNSKGGRGHKKRLESLKRIQNVSIEFTRISDPNTNAAIQQSTFATNILAMVTDEFEGDSCLYIQFPPVMVRWLEESYTYIDLDIRRQLTDNGKAIHKFLSSQTNINISVKKLHNLTGTGLPMNRFLSCLRETLEKLESLGWLQNYELCGNGRKQPYVLTGRRTTKKSNPNDDVKSIEE